jgi:tetratricopeptide (TPR) repeat protein
VQSSTSSSGQFNFNGLQAGTYLLQLEAPGFQANEIRLDLTFTSQPGLILYLKPAPQNAPPSGVSATISVHELSISEEARNLYLDEKKQLYSENNAEKALGNFRKALDKAPEFYEALYQVGMAYVSLGKLDEAQQYFRRCIAESGDKYGSANIALGTLQLDNGEAASGEKQIRHGLELSPSAWMGYYQLGKWESLAGRLDDAEKHAEQARQFAPATPMVYQLLANIHMKQKNFPALLDDIDAYVRLDPESPAAVRAKEIRTRIQQQMQAEAASR